MSSDAKHEDKTRLEAVIQFADNILTDGRDRYRETPSPLFADGLNMISKEHIFWGIPGQGNIVISNLACQQNLMRTLTALTNLTGNTAYKEAAKAAIGYMFERYTDQNGLLFWGGHRMIDLRTLQVSGPSNKDLVHELKNVFPYYDLLYEVDPEATANYISACWNAHIINWENLEINRHGKYDLAMPMSPWTHPLVDHPPLREANGLSFINIGDDLIYAAGTLYRKSGERGALSWAKHLAKQYVQARHPKTGLGAYQFTQPKNTGEITSDRDSSKFGDRAKRQFGPEFGEIALEGNVLFKHHAYAIYSKNALIQLQLATDLGEDASELLEWTIQGLLAFAKYAYLPNANSCKPMFTDGTDLTGFTFPRDGYYGPAGARLETYSAAGFLLPYARAYRLTGDDAIWIIAHQIAKGNGLGDIGVKPGKNVRINTATDSAHIRDLFAMLDLYWATRCDDYLTLARILGKNILTRHFVEGYFVPTPQHLYASCDAVEPLGLLALQAAIEGDPALTSTFLDGNGEIHGAYELPDGRVIASLHGRVLYNLLRHDEIRDLQDHGVFSATICPSNR